MPTSWESYSPYYGFTPVYATEASGLVYVVFHTYSGSFPFATQTEHRFWATPDNARIALKDLHQYNLSHGMFAYGGLFIPLLSLGNYWAQKRSITKQEKALDSVLSNLDSFRECEEKDHG